MATHYIHLYGPINQSSCDQLKSVCLQALAQGATDIVFHLSSDGGSTLYGFTLYHFIKSLPVTTTAHNLGNIESMAVIVYLAAQKRFACQHSRFILHPLHWSFGNAPVGHSKLRESVSSLDNDLERYSQIFCEQTKGAEKPLNILSCLSGQEEVVAATTAVSQGIAHSVSEASVPKGAINWWVNIG